MRKSSFFMVILMFFAVVVVLMFQHIPGMFTETEKSVLYIVALVVVAITAVAALRMVHI